MLFPNKASTQQNGNHQIKIQPVKQSIALACLGAMSLLSLHSHSQESHPLDWVPKEQLSEAQRALCPVNCNGAYVTPERDGLEANAPPSVDRLNGKVTLNGNIRIREPDILLIGEQAIIDAEKGELRVEQAQYVFAERHIRGTASSVNRTEQTGISIHNASYTSCEPGDDAWLLNAKEIKINENTGRAVAKGVHIEAAGIPLFYAPIFSFVTDDRRLSGFLYPELSTNNLDGLSYSQPFYLNLAENQDLTLTPRLTTERGSGLEAEYRLLTENSYSSLSGAYFPSDRINPEFDENRWLAHILHRSELQDWTLDIDYSDVSDDEVIDDWDTQVFDFGTRELYLRQHVSLGYGTKHWQYQLSTTRYESLVNSEFALYREQPRLSAKGQYQWNNGLALQFNSELTRFDHENDNNNLGASGFQLGADNTWITGERLRLSADTSYRHEWQSAYIQPNAALHYLGYQLDSPVASNVTNTSSQPESIAPEIGLDSGITFERDAFFFNGQQRQTLEVRLNYLFRDADNQNDQPVYSTAFLLFR